MTPNPPPTPSVSWRRRALRRSAGTVGVAVVLAGIGPAIANAAGADVHNPIAFALKASGKGIAKAFSTESDEAEVVASPCVTPTATVEPTAEPTAEPTVEPTDETSVEPTAEPTAEPSVEESAEPTPAEESPVVESPAEETPVVESPAESAEPSEEPADDCDEASPSPTASPEAEEADDEDGEHGQIVSTVAHCAPKGQDPLLDLEGAPSNHGGYVKAAAHGDTLTLPWGEYDLSTQAGADDLCASLAAARESLPDEDAATKQHGKKDKTHGRPDKAGKPHKSHGKHGGS